MAPPPLPADNTARYLIRYTSGGLPHVSQIRLNSGPTEEQITAYLESVTDAMKPIMAPTDNVLGVDWIPEGSVISQPYPHDFTGAGSASGTTNNAENRTCFFSMTGKDELGYKVRVTLFALVVGNFVDYRQPIGVVNPLFADWWSAISALGQPQAVTVSENRPFWKTYLNIGQNSHFQRKQR